MSNKTINKHFYASHGNYFFLPAKFLSFPQAVFHPRCLTAQLVWLQTDSTDAPALPVHIRCWWLTSDVNSHLTNDKRRHKHMLRLKKKTFVSTQRGCFVCVISAGGSIQILYPRKIHCKNTVNQEKVLKVLNAVLNRKKKKRFYSFLLTFSSFFTNNYFH